MCRKHEAKIGPQRSVVAYTPEQNFKFLSEEMKRSAGLQGSSKLRVLEFDDLLI